MRSLQIAALLTLCLCQISAGAQENWMLKGYVKAMSAMQSVDDGDIAIENLLHNRFDFNGYLTDELTISAGLRNRVIVGNNVTLIPNYVDFVSRDPGYLNLSWVWADESSWIGLSQLDRLMLDYTSGKLQVTLGRQRINWGQSFVWNPNDLFNTYSYFDFDYEERPGSDALRLQYYIGSSSKLEWSTALDSNKKLTSVGLFRWNTSGYDIQFLAGLFKESDYVLGGGWAGSIAGGGFAGELTYFHPRQERDDREGKLTATVHYDYTFQSSLQLQFEALYNGFGAETLSGGIGDLLFQDLDPKNLFPTRFAVFGSGGYDLSPLLRVMLAGMYGPEGNFFYLGPTLNYSLSDAIELSGFGQYFSSDEVFDLQGDPIPTDGTAIFARLKWSF